MEYKEIKDIICSIKESVQKGEYKVSYEEPNNIERCTAPDGRTFYKVVDMDGVKSSTLFGSCEVEVNGFHFSFDWGNGYWGDDAVESDFFDELDDCYELEDGSCIYKDDIIEEITDAFDERDDIYTGTYVELDDQMWIYSKINNLKDPEYYWCEDSDCPIDVDNSWYDFTPPQKLEYGTIEYNGDIFYLVEEPTEENLGSIHAVYAERQPDDKARYATVVMRLENTEGKLHVLDIEESEDEYNACEGYIE